MLIVRYSDQAVKFLTKIGQQDARRIMSKVKQYANNPQDLQNKVKKLTNSIYYRLRVGDYRVIFTETGEVMNIEKIGNRGDIYRRI